MAESLMSNMSKGVQYAYGYTGAQQEKESLDKASAQISADLSALTATSGNMPFEYSTDAVGSAYRGLGSDWFNGGNIAKEDWLRAEQSGNNALLRDLYYLTQQNAFNAQEAQKDRDWQEKMSNTAYQRVVADLKAAGLNPILAYSNGGSTTPSGSVANSAGGRNSSGQVNYRGRAANTSALVGSLLQLAGGLMIHGSFAARTPKPAAGALPKMGFGN